MKKHKRGETKICHRLRDTTSVVSSVNSNVTCALTVQKPSKPQPKRRRNTASLSEPSDQAPQKQPGPSMVLDPQTQNES